MACFQKIPCKMMMPHILNQFPMMNLFQINSASWTPRQFLCVETTIFLLGFYDMNIPNALFKIVKGENIGTLIS